MMLKNSKEICSFMSQTVVTISGGDSGKGTGDSSGMR